MKRNGMFSVWFVTIYLVLYGILMQFRVTAPVALVMIFLSPLLIIWMVRSLNRLDRVDS